MDSEETLILGETAMDEETMVVVSDTDTHALSAIFGPDPLVELCA